MISKAQLNKDLDWSDEDYQIACDLISKQKWKCFFYLLKRLDSKAGSWDNLKLATTATFLNILVLIFDAWVQISHNYKGPLEPLKFRYHVKLF